MKLMFLRFIAASILLQVFAHLQEIAMQKTTWVWHMLICVFFYIESNKLTYLLTYLPTYKRWQDCCSIYFILLQTSAHAQ